MTGSIFETAIDGNKDAKAVVINEKIEIDKIDLIVNSLGISSRK